MGDRRNDKIYRGHYRGLQHYRLWFELDRILRIPEPGFCVGAVSFHV